MKESIGTAARFVYRDKAHPHGWARLNPTWFLRQRWNRLFFPLNARIAAKASGELLVMHPQSIKPALLESIITSRHKTWLYVVDAHFFCERNYNILREESKPCLLCLGGSDAPGVNQGCFNAGKGWPLRARFVEWVRSGKVKLLAQCESQARLLNRYYGEDVPVKVVPLMAPDIFVPPGHSIPSMRARPLVVFHGAPNVAKGILITRELARRLPSCDFLVPAAFSELARYGGPTKGWPSNVSFHRMIWGKGLAEAVASADLVLCPSVWSAPVEGAILKSLSHNGLVGLIPDSTSFASNIPPAARVDINPADLSVTVELIKSILSNPAAQITIRAAARRYMKDYCDRNQGFLQKLYSACTTT